MIRALMAGCAAGALTVSIVAGGSVAQAASAPGVQIVAIYFDSPGSDYGSNTSLNAEWVRIRNVTGRTKTLTGWTLRDAANHVYHFPTLKLAAGVAVRVHTGHGTRSAGNLYWGSSAYIWNNTGDSAVLKNASGVRIDHCSYTSSQDPEAYC